MRLTPGQNAPRSGSYKVIDSRGRNVGSVYMEAGERMPPTQQEGGHYEMD